MSAEERFFRLRLAAMGGSFIVGLGLMGLKFYVYSITQSAAVLSDALESIINVVASAFGLWSVILARKPPDSTHPYGHGKIEYFSAGFEGALIMLAAVGIIREGIQQLTTPRDLMDLANGLLILLVTSLVNFALGFALVRLGKHTHSLILTADGKHILTDVYTSAGVLLGLLVVHLTGLFWLDGVVAIAVALNILYVGGKLIRESFAGLMDASDTELLNKITQIISENRKDTWIDVHKLRAWKSGNSVYVDFHLILPRGITLEAAHHEVTQLENLLNQHLTALHAQAFIHAEPCIDPECPICGYDPCSIRAKPALEAKLWRRDTITTGLQETRPERHGDPAPDEEVGREP